MSSLLPGDSEGTIRQVGKDIADGVKGLFGGDEHAPLETVERVDLTKYAGTWYELARLPMTFQSATSLSVAKYALQDDGSVSVHNLTYEGEKQTHDIDGVATPADGAEETFNRLKVTFGGVLKVVPVADEGNYWVLKLADDYTMALVGTPDRDALWLLAREKSGYHSDRAQEWLGWAKDNGFDTDAMLIDDWDAGAARPAKG